MAREEKKENRDEERFEGMQNTTNGRLDLHEKDLSSIKKSKNIQPWNGRK